MDSKDNSSTKIALSIILGFVVALLAMGLPMIGITVNLYLGVFVLLLAFVLLAYGFWRWETASRWGDSARVSTLWILGIMYFGLVGFQVYRQYSKDHSPLPRTIAPALVDVSPKSAILEPPSLTKTTIPKKRSETPRLSSPTQTQTAETVSAPNGLAIGGGVVTNPTVNNFSPPERVLREEQISTLSRLVGQQATSSPFSISFQVGDDEAFRFARSIATGLAKAGWQLAPPASMMQGGLNHGIWICGGRKEDQERLRDALIKSGYDDIAIQNDPTKEMFMLVGANKGK